MPKTPRKLRTAPQAGTVSPGAALRRVSPWIPFCLLVGVWVVWCQGDSGPFVLDDRSSIVTNETLRHPWAMHWLAPPATSGETVSGRPVLNASFALNYAVSGLHVWSYHLSNMLVHVCATLALFGIVRRTVLLREGSRRGDAEAAQSAGVCDVALPAAVTAATAWSVHPLQTAAVTYISQRAESLAGFWYLLTLYAFVRGATAAGGDADRRAGRGWYVLSVVACLLGVGSKETACTAPVLLLLYDHTFLAGSLRAAWRARGRVYFALAATWVPLAMLVWGGAGRGGSAGFGAGIGPWSYLCTQAWAIVHYLRLAVWPAGLVFDYGTPLVPGFGAVAPQFLALAVVAGIGCWACWRRRAAGFLIVSFFLLLAPSSSVVPVGTQTIAEHRMYLPLAAVVLLAGLGGAWLMRVVRHGPARDRGPAVAVPVRGDGSGRGAAGYAQPGRLRGLAPLLAGLVACGALAWTTVSRERVYGSALSLWEDTVAKRPDNPRAQYNLGVALEGAGRGAEAMSAYERAVSLRPEHAFAHERLGRLLIAEGKVDEAVRHLRLAVAAQPDLTAAWINLGSGLDRLGQAAAALAAYEKAVALEPHAPDACTGLATLLLHEGDLSRAEGLLRGVVSRDPDFAEAHYRLGLTVERARADTGEAEREYRAAVRAQPDYAAAHVALGSLLADRGEEGPATGEFQEALKLDPRQGGAHFGLGNMAASRADYAAAITDYMSVTPADPLYPRALQNMGNCYLVMGRTAEAITTYEQVLRLLPGDPDAQQNLAVARDELRRSGGR